VLCLAHGSDAVVNAGTTYPYPATATILPE